MSVLSGDVYQTQVIGRVFGQVVRHVRTWFIDSVSGVIPDDQTFMQAFLDDTKVAAAHDKVTPYFTCLSSNWLGESYQVQKTDPVRFYRKTVDLPPATVGLRGPTNTGNTQGAINVNGVFGAKRYRGSYKIGPIATLDCVNGILQAGLLVALDTYANSFLLPLSVTAGGGSAILFPAVYHAGTRIPFTPGTADQIVAYRVRTQVRVKGTRTIGYGE